MFVSQIQNITELYQGWISILFSHSSWNYVILGVLMGITNMAATIPGFLVPAVVGALTHGKVMLHNSKSNM